MRDSRRLVALRTWKHTQSSRGFKVGNFIVDVCARESSLRFFSLSRHLEITYSTYSVSIFFFFRVLTNVRVLFASIISDTYSRSNVQNADSLFFFPFTLASLLHTSVTFLYKSTSRITRVTVLLPSFLFTETIEETRESSFSQHPRLSSFSTSCSSN